MKVTVKKVCFIGGQRHRAGAVVEIGDSPLSEWMVPTTDEVETIEGEEQVVLAPRKPKNQRA